MRTISKTIFTSIALMAATTVATADDQLALEETPAPLVPPPAPSPAPPAPTPEPTPAPAPAPLAPAPAPVVTPAPAPTTPAQTPTPDGTTSKGTATPGANAPPTTPTDLPEAKSDHDAQPEVAGIGGPDGGIISQAGVGGLVGYGRAGVLELGGSAGFAFASNYRSMNISPTIGWFLADNLELSAILSLSNIKTGNEQSTLWSALAEPSYHIPFNRTLFFFLGLGAGAAHVSAMGTGFAVAPRAGMNFMVGRSGVLTPALTYQYTTIKTEMAPGDVTVVALTSQVRFNIGYTAMW